MSTKQNSTQTQNKESTKGRTIAKVIFCIVIFNIVVRSDLWISISLFFFIGLYLLQNGMVKKVPDCFMLPWFEAQIAAIAKRAAQWIAKKSSGQQQQPARNAPVIITDRFDIWRNFSKRDRQE